MAQKGLHEQPSFVHSYLCTQTNVVWTYSRCLSIYSRTANTMPTSYLSSIVYTLQKRAVCCNGLYGLVVYKATASQSQSHQVFATSSQQPAMKDSSLILLQCQHRPSTDSSTDSTCARPGQLSSYDCHTMTDQAFASADILSEDYPGCCLLPGTITPQRSQCARSSLLYSMLIMSLFTVTLASSSQRHKPLSSVVVSRHQCTVQGHSSACRRDCLKKHSTKHSGFVLQKPDCVCFMLLLLTDTLVTADTVTPDPGN